MIQKICGWQRAAKGQRLMRVLLFGLLFALGAAGSVFAAPVEPTPQVGEQDITHNYNGNLVYEIEISGEIDSSLSAYVKRGYDEAQADKAAYMIVMLDTYGGYVDSAVEIKKTIMESPIHTICYINDKAISAGALIALACDDIVMAPGSTIGAAEPKIGGEKADEKTVSFWSAELAGAAEYNGRNPQIAAAMADSDIAIPDVVEKGKLLTLTSAQAIDLGMADKEVVNRQLLLEEYGLGSAVVIEVEPDFQENIARFLTSSWVSTILLAVGLGGLVLELLFTGFGIFGGISVVALALYFIGGLLVGYAGWLSIALLIAAIVLLLLEIFVIPGFGVAGGLGIACLVGSIIAVAPSLGMALGQMGFAIIVVIVLVVISLKAKRTRRVWNRLILKDSTSTEEGYISQPSKINSYVGKEGVALTTLRPAGAVQIGDERVDVVTEGSFVSPGEAVVVIKVDGSSVIVRKKHE